MAGSGKQRSKARAKGLRQYVALPKRGESEAKPRSLRAQAVQAEPRQAATAANMLAAIVRSSDAAIIGKTPDGIVISWNAGAERIFGYAAAEMIGKPIHVIASRERPHEMRDITARRPTEDLLKSRTAQLDDFAHALDLAPAMVRTPKGKILFWGHGLRALFGWTAAESGARFPTNCWPRSSPCPWRKSRKSYASTGNGRHKDGRLLVVWSGVEAPWLKRFIAIA
jgi:PAS domain-containing protein